MYCRMIRGVYLRSNGEMACYCGPGEEVVLGQIPENKNQYNFINDFYFNKGHQNVRECMKNNVLPYPDVCLKCIYLEPFMPDEVELLNQEIEWMHIEATSLCNLDCHYCIPFENRKTYRKEPFFLPFEMYRKIIEDICAAQMQVKWMYFSGRGEPGLHKQLWEMVKLAKDNLDTNFLVNTNGNIPFSEMIVDSGLDKIKIAIDGADQETYVAYRRRGNLNKVLDLTHKISALKQQIKLQTPKIIWQYVLFSHNDSMEQLEKIQRLAIEAGVDELLFKSTFSHNYSQVDLKSIPKIHPNIKMLDMMGMVTISQDELEQKLYNLEDLKERSNWNELVINGIDVAKSIFRNFALGIERKQLYNELGQLDDVERMSEMARYHGDEFLMMKQGIEKSFDAIALAYDKVNNSQAATYYHRFLEKMNSENKG